MEINIKITPAEVVNLVEAREKMSVPESKCDEETLSLFCDNYCKYPDGHIDQDVLDQICDRCPMRLFMED